MFAVGPETLRIINHRLCDGGMHSHVIYTLVAGTLTEFRPRRIYDVYNIVHDVASPLVIHNRD